MAGGPLQGVKVLEMTQIIAGPFCGMNLADLGADVVKIEAPGGEGGRSLGASVPGESKFFHTLNRGKRSLVINLQHERGRQVVHRIIPDYDVFVINSRPGVPQRLKIDYETLKVLRPDLIYMENTGYGTSGPSAERSGSDIVAQAYSGLMVGDGKVDEHGAPRLITATAPADYTAGLAAAMGVCAALFHRGRTGEGQYVGTSLLVAGLALQAGAVSRAPTFDALVRDPMIGRVEEVRRASGSYQDMLDARGDIVRQLGGAFTLYYGGYEVKDGAIILGALTALNREQMRKALGIDDDPTADPEFNALDTASEALTDAMSGRIREIMKTRTMDEWEAAFAVEGAPVSRVNLAEEMADDPQVQALGIMVDMEHELTGPETMVGAIVQMSATPTGSDVPSPPLDRHTDEVLVEHGFTQAEVAELRAANAVGVPVA